MAESRQNSSKWEPDDELEAERLEMMRQLSESAQLSAGSKNVRVYKGALGGTAISVDEDPFRYQPPLVKITGSASGGGKYTGTLLQRPTANIPATGDLTEAEIGIDADPVVVVRILNTREVGAATHDLASSAFLPLVFPAIFLKIADDGVPVYAIDGRQQEDC